MFFDLFYISALFAAAHLARRSLTALPLFAINCSYFSAIFILLAITLLCFFRFILIYSIICSCSFCAAVFDRPAVVCHKLLLFYK